MDMFRTPTPFGQLDRTNFETPQPRPFFINVEINKKTDASVETKMSELDLNDATHAEVEEDDDVIFSGSSEPKVSPDPDFVINMKLRQQVHYYYRQLSSCKNSVVITCNR